MSWVGRTSWQLRLLDGWRANDSPECLTITKSNDGALQLSEALKTNGEITAAELRKFYEPRIPDSETFREVAFGAFRGFAAQFYEHDVLWHKFWLAHGNLMVFATYNGIESAWNAEKREVVESKRKANAH